MRFPFCVCARIDLINSHLIDRHIAEGKHVKDFPWTQWVEKAYELQLCLHNWPKKLPAPGADFKYKELSQLQLEVLLGPTRTKAALKQWESDLRAGDDSDNEDECTDEDIIYARHEAAPKFFKDVQIMPWTQGDYPYLRWQRSSDLQCVCR